MRNVPQKPPQLSKAAALSILKRHGVSLPAIIGIRGYYRNSMGEDGDNDFGIYDDAMFICTDLQFASFNANVDPTKYEGSTACLELGTWYFKIGTHGLNKTPEQRYQALVQADKVIVIRATGVREGGFFGINIHKGGIGSTGSLGCQTLYPTQWDNFIDLVKTILNKSGQSKIPYLLIDESELKLATVQKEDTL